MMMMDDAKKKADMIVIGIGKKPESDAEMSEMEMEAAHEIMEALKEDDMESFAYALKTFIELCLEAGYQ